MANYRVKVRYLTKGYTIVEAESKAEAIMLVENGDYEDILGERSEDLEVISATEEK